MKFINRINSLIFTIERRMNRAEIKSKRASLELEEARGRRGETGEQWKWNTARGPPRGPDVPPTVTAVQLTSISFDPRTARFCSRLSIVRETRLRDPSKNRDSTLTRKVKVSLKSYTFVSIVLLLPHPWKIRTEERKERGRTLREIDNRASSSSKNARIGSPVLVT